MYKNLRFKIILILVIFTIILMSVVGTVLLVSTNNFYKNDFKKSMQTALDEKGEIVSSLSQAMEKSDYISRQGDILRSYIATLGINEERNYYILDMTGEPLSGSDMSFDLEITENILSAMSGKTGDKVSILKNYADYALPLSLGENEVIIYIYDTQSTAKKLTDMFFQIILQSLFIGIFISVILSFFLAQAITDPIEALTASAEKISKGEFSEEIKPRADDEIGTLSTTFNYMKNALKDTLDEVSGERAKVETLFLYLNEAVLAFDSEGNLIHINKMAQELFKTDSSNGITFQELIKELNIDSRELADSFKEKRNSILRDVIYNDKAFDITFAEFTYNSTGETGDGIMCVIHDNTGRFELDKMRREFVADVSHELKTPLTSIKGALETIKEYPNLDDQTKNAFIDMAVEECNRMSRIVSDLLVLSRLDNKRTKWNISEFNPSDLISYVCMALDGAVKSKEHKLSVKIEENIPNISGDKEKLEQVLINIIGNSIKYTENGGRIRIEAYSVNNTVEIAVTDNGVGIPDEDLPRVFERFYRVEKSRTTGAGGTGLGLAIAREIVVAHGGDVKISSKTGVGTRIVVILPIITNLEDSEGNDTII